MFEKAREGRVEQRNNNNSPSRRTSNSKSPSDLPQIARGTPGGSPRPGSKRQARASHSASRWPSKSAIPATPHLGGRARGPMQLGHSVRFPPKWLRIRAVRRSRLHKHAARTNGWAHARPQPHGPDRIPLPNAPCCPPANIMHTHTHKKGQACKECH